MSVKLVLGISSPGSTPLIKGQIKYFVDKGYSVYLMCPLTSEVRAFCEDEGCEHIPVPVKRNLSAISDIRSLIIIHKALRKIQPDIVNVGTPKMGLLGMIASFLNAVPLRIYTCRGLSYQLKSGIYARILMWMESLSHRLAHKVICVGPAMQRKAIEDAVFNSEKCVVIGDGGSNGVDLSRFSRQSIDEMDVDTHRAKYRLDGCFVYGFVGRMVNRKGVYELYEAFDEIFRDHPQARLLWVGTVETTQLRDLTLPEKVRQHPGIIYVGWQNDIPLHMALMDVFVIPSWWEGFGNVHIQAAAMGLPVITTSGVGCVDAVKDGFNGTVVGINNVQELRAAMVKYFTNDQLRIEHGRNGIEWSKKFRSPIIWSGLLDLYRRNLRKAS